jgi:ABC-2 type transport system ATP-binding protein
MPVTGGVLPAQAKCLSSLITPPHPVYNQQEGGQNTKERTMTTTTSASSTSAMNQLASANMNIIEVTGLVKRYRELVALDNLDLTIEKGEVFGLLGPNGSGKTTAINCMLQLLTYDKGAIRLFGEDMSPTRYDLKRRIGIVPQNIAVFSQLNVIENIDYFCSLYVSNKTERRALVEEAIEFVGLQDYRRFRPRKLSGGLMRRLNIACGIAHKPELIFFDEPTVAVDPQSRNSILEGILRLNAEGSTIVYTSHYMEEVEQICSRIMIMDRGKALATGTNAELKSMVGVNERIEIELAGAVDFQPALELVRELPHTATARLDGNTLRISCSRGSQNLSDTLNALTSAGIAYGRVYSEPPTLNDVFLEITGKELRD